MDISDIIYQLQEGQLNRRYQYHCCGIEFNSFYEFRKHLYEIHPEEYVELEPYLHREQPKQLTKEERKASIKKAMKRKEAAKKRKSARPKVDYSKQPTAWIIYNHNGPKK